MATSITVADFRNVLTRVETGSMSIMDFALFCKERLPALLDHHEDLTDLYDEECAQR